MRLLLDTHVVAWSFLEAHKLSRRAREAIVNPSAVVFVSAVVVWEIATKNRIGKWPVAGRVLARLDDAMEQARFKSLPISLAHARRAGSLEGDHRDPFDRVLAAQSLLEGLTLVSVDPAFATFGVPVLWAESP